MKLALGLLYVLLLCPSAGAQSYYVRQGKPGAAIVAPHNNQGMTSLAAHELQKYIGELTGARLEITDPSGTSAQAKDQVLILVGGPEANSLVQKAAGAGQLDFRGLKPEGFLLKTIDVKGRPALVIGGNDESGTLYGAYDWLERQGIVFQISKDIIPNHRDSLPLNRLDVRSAPAFAQRGMGISSCYETRSIWSYNDIVKFIDQMAKLKLNFLTWLMFSPEPYLEYSYAGEKKLMGDEASWEGGYTLPAHNFGSRKVESYFIGKEAFQAFGKEYMAPDEWQGVQDQERVFASARDRLQRVIHYARTRNIKVWIALESPNEFDPNIARYCRLYPYNRPYGNFTGSFVCPTDPAVYKINELRFQALLQSYPEAAGFIFWMNEGYPVCHHPEDIELFATERPNYQSAKELLLQTHRSDNYTFLHETADDAIDNCIGSVNLIQKMIAVRNRLSPQTKIGVGMWGRAFLLPTLDKVLPKDVLLVDNETSGVWTPKGVPIQLFGGMGERNRIFMHVGDDDTGMVNLQFHLRLYYRDRMLEGAIENGAQGVTELGDRFRGEEHLAKYMADGAWSPHLTPDQFYRDYARRIFGERAVEPMMQAFSALEDAEGYKGYHSTKPHDITLMACCAPPDELRTMKRYADQPDPYDGPAFQNWKDFTGVIPDRIELFTGERALEEKALAQMKAAEAVAAPGSLGELQYLENKTEAYCQVLTSFIQLDEALAAYDQAFHLDPRTQHTEFLARLDSSLEGFRQARLTARYSAQTWAKVIDNVSDLGVLWRLNTFLVVGTDLVERFVENNDNYHHGRPYLNVVEWERIFSPLPVMSGGPTN